jgi:isocitrate dehydrogenase kinase/phosphatase
MDLADAAIRAADAIERSFDAYHRDFRETTRRVKGRFEERDWRGVRELTVERMHLQSDHVRQALEEVRAILGKADAAADARGTWHELKAAFSRAVLGRDDVELAKTFFNSLTRKVFSHVGVDPAIDYQDEDIPLPYAGWEMASARMYAVREVDAWVVRRILADASFGVPFRDLDEDARLAAAAIERGIQSAFGGHRIEALDVLRPVFFRNKGAYLVGRARRGGQVMPLTLALLHEEDGLRVDAVLPTEDEVSIVFSFARWYFHADVESPREVIGFLHSILPRKRLAELYISLGYNKHGKTEFYRDLVHRVREADERFVVAPGKRGLVMAVFTLPSFQFVFKVIKDRFPPQKPFTRDQVQRKYRHVLMQDRVGRMVDFQEFEHLPLPRERFSDDLLAELLEVCGGTVRVRGDQVVLDHVYVERRVEPLDLYVRHQPNAAAEAAVIDYGECLKDLAAADVFPGDLLLKNFGVTRHGRVVFYDYDEVSTLSELRFRKFPESRDPYQEMSADPWFSVDDKDVFPEELDRFLGLDGDLRRVFEHHHGDLFELDFWRRMQERHEQGEIIDFYPYDEERRLRGEERAVDAASA